MSDFPNNPNDGDTFIDDNDNLWEYQVSIWVLRSGEISELRQLKDVSVTNLTSGDGLRWNSTISKFENHQIPTPVGNDANKTYPTNRYFFKVRNSSKQFTMGVTDIVPFDLIEFDPSNVFNVNTYQMTAQKTGYYKLSATIFNLVSSCEVYVYLYVNNVYHSLIYGVSSDSPFYGRVMNNTLLVKLTQNDVVDVRYNTNTTGSLDNDYHQSVVPRNAESEFYGYLYRDA